MFYSVHIRIYSVFSALKLNCLGLGLGFASWCLGHITDKWWALKIRIMNSSFSLFSLFSAFFRAVFTFSFPKLYITLQIFKACSLP